MSLGIAIKGPEGLVLAAESRVTIAAKDSSGEDLLVNFDNATKVINFHAPNTAVGVVTYGAGSIGVRTANSFAPEFEASLPPERLAIGDFAQRLSDFFAQQWKTIMPADYKGSDMTFLVGGFNVGEPYGRLYRFSIPTTPAPTEQGAADDFGMMWGGQRDVVDRLMQGYDSSLPYVVGKHLGLDDQKIDTLIVALQPLEMPVPILAMALQDCVDLAIFFIRTTIDAQKLTTGIRGCGGPIDVATVTRQDGLKFVQRKQVKGEAGGQNG